MVLIGVDVHAAEFLEVDKPMPVVLYEVAKRWLTGTMPDVARCTKCGSSERRGRGGLLYSG